VQADPVGNLRRSVIIGACLGIASIVVLAFFGHALAGVFGCVGIALGALNNRLLQRSVINYAANEQMNKVQFRHGVLGRLLLMTAIAIVIALIFRPDGLGVFAGLAVFQVLMLISASVPVFRSLRPS
jgi:hypothetical protein